MGFYLCQNAKFLNPLTVLTWLLPVDRTGRPSLKSVDRVGRPTCTDVHSSSSWRAGDRSDRPPESFCSLESPGRPTESCALCSRPRSTGPVDRGSNGQISDRCRSTRPVDRQQPELLTGPQRLVFG